LLLWGAEGEQAMLNDNKHREHLYHDYLDDLPSGLDDYNKGLALLRRFNDLDHATAMQVVNRWRRVKIDMGVTVRQMLEG